MAVTINTLREFKQKGEAFAALTSYDATFSQVVSEAGVHVILIGDSLGMVLQGHDSTLPVTMGQSLTLSNRVAAGNDAGVGVTLRAGTAVLLARPGAEGDVAGA